MRKFIKKLKNSLIVKILKIPFKIIIWIIELIIIFLAIVIITQRVTADQKAFLGFRIYNVATGSMEPEYAVGDVLISREKDPSKIEVGENIVYLGEEGGYKGKIITHNVIKIERDEKGDYLFHTKGRANTVEDPIVHEDQLYGVIVNNNKVLAFICKVLLNRYGLFFCVVIPITLYCFIGFIKAQGERIEQEKEEERERKRLQEERRAKQRRRRKLQEAREQEMEEIQEQDEIEEVIKTPKKTKPKAKTETKVKADAKPKTRAKTKTETESKQVKTEKNADTAKKSTKTKRAKEE